ncbi:hypothetical protein CCUG63697_04680 [Mycobacteroides franklinii]|uniref:Uncharacterized protein n=1 Tax=Mycobacteroides franklinii TaxID=948102 RepID=A0A4R8QZN7_9MYCO|nr:hypothetical protein CCUG63697_04680 [Mycobacteroides franklinii]
MSQSVRCLIQPAIGHRTVTETDRDRLRITNHLLGEQLRNRQRPWYRPNQSRTITPHIQRGTLSLFANVDCRQRPPWINGHRRQHVLEPVREGAGIAVREQIPHTRRAEEELFIVLDKDKPELIHQAGVGHGPRSGGSGEVRQTGGRNEVDGRVIRRSLTPLESRLVLKGTQRKSLMLQSFLDPRVDMLAKAGHGSRRRGCQSQRYDAGAHARHEQCLWAHPSTHGEIEYHLGTTDLAMHQ